MATRRMSRIGGSSVSRMPLRELIEHVIERRAPAEHPERDLARQRTIAAILERGAGARERGRQDPVPLRTACNGLISRPAGGAHRPPNRSPGRTRWPARKSRAVIGRLPSGWISSTRSAVSSPAATIRSSPCGLEDDTRIGGAGLGDRPLSGASYGTGYANHVAMAGQKRVRMRPGVQAAYAIMERARRFIPVEQAVLLCQLPAYVARAWSCGVSIASPREMASTTSGRGPRRARPGRAPRRRWSRLGPPRVAPSRTSAPRPAPARPHDRDAGLGDRRSITARWIGDAPRYRGSSDAWTLMKPSRGIASRSSGRIRPKAATTPRSGARGAKRVQKRPRP